MDSSSEQRADLARKSRSFTCSTCGIEHATCPLAATPFTVSLAVDPQSPVLRAAGGAAKPATPLSNPIATASPRPSDNATPPSSSPSVTAQSPAAAALSPPAQLSTVAAAREAAAPYDASSPPAPAAQRVPAAAPPAAQRAAPATRALPRATNNRALPTPRFRSFNSAATHIPQASLSTSTLRLFR